MTQPEAVYRTPADVLPKLSALIHSDALSNGDRARLRRTPLMGPTPAAYHRFVVRWVPEPFQGPRYDLGWRTVLSALADQRQNPHNPKRPFGQALHDAGFSEARLERLLASSDRSLSTLLTRATRRLATAGISCHWASMARQFCLCALNRSSMTALGSRSDAAQ